MFVTIMISENKTKRNIMKDALVTVSLSTSELEDPDFVDAELDRIYKEFGKDPDEKSTALTGLVNAIRTRDGSHLGDEILDSIIDAATEETPETEGATMRRKVLKALTPSKDVRHPEIPVSTLEVQIDVDTLDILNILRKTVLPDENERSVKAKRNMQKRLPSGPKQNETSGGISKIDPDKRR